MEQKITIPETQTTKDTLLKKAGSAVGNLKEKLQDVKENVEEKAEALLDKAKESKLVEKAKEKLGGL